MTGGMVGARASSMIQDGEDRIGSRNGARVCRKWDRRGSSAPSVVENRWSSSERSRPVTSALETRRFVRFDGARETRNGSDFGESPTRIRFLSGRTSKEKYGEAFGTRPSKITDPDYARSIHVPRQMPASSSVTDLSERGRRGEASPSKIRQASTRSFFFSPRFIARSIWRLKMKTFGRRYDSI